MIEFFITYWKPIIGLLFTITGFVIALIKKRPISDLASDIYYWCIGAIQYAENLDKVNGLKGQNKLNAALIYVFDKFKDKYPTIDVSRYGKMIEQIIETILSTPEKK